jgi:medium-chain acyl-[acyl-carrier-protein] hydrolase
MLRTPVSRWLSCPRPNPKARLRLFCFPYAGGDVLLYRPWAQGLPPTVELQLIQLPGRGVRLAESPFTSVEPLIRAAAPALLPYCDRPFAFFGHSMGAVISFELSHLLRSEHNLSPQHLFVSGRRAPQEAASHPPIHDLPEPEFIEELRQLNGTPQEVLEHAELLQLFLPLLRADFAVAENYRYEPRPRLDCPITAYCGMEDRDAPREQMEGWREQTTASFALRMLPGDHFFINSARALLLESLSRELVQLTDRLPPI